jgi:small subunit ribosomal protein S21
MSVKVTVRNNNLEGALIAFKKKVQAAGILEEYRERQFFKKPSEIKREKRKEAVRWQKIKRKQSS